MILAVRRTVGARIFQALIRIHLAAITAGVIHVVAAGKNCSVFHLRGDRRLDVLSTLAKEPKAKPSCSIVDNAESTSLDTRYTIRRRSGADGQATGGRLRAKYTSSKCGKPYRSVRGYPQRIQSN